MSITTDGLCTGCSCYRTCPLEGMCFSVPPPAPSQPQPQAWLFLQLTTSDVDIYLYSVYCLYNYHSSHQTVSPLRAWALPTPAVLTGCRAGRISVMACLRMESREFGLTCRCHEKAYGLVAATCSYISLKGGITPSQSHQQLGRPCLVVTCCIEKRG